ncbi:hypothetical protein ACFLS9_04130 [Bacteroidota bacterium]
MLPKDRVEKIVKKVIEKEEKLGEQSGGSGHLGYIDYKIDKISDPRKVEEGWVIDFDYTTIITTEFTIEPDNPPYQYHHSKSILLDKNGKLIESRPKSSIPGKHNPFGNIDEIDLDI